MFCFERGKMKRLFRALLLFFVLITSCSEKKPEPPVAKIIPHKTRKHGIELIDNYHWLKDKSRTDKDVINYIKAENKYSEEMMKHTRKFQKKLYDEITGRIKKDEQSVSVKIDDYYYYSRNEAGKQYRIYCRKKGSLEAPEDIYLDANELAGNYDFFNIYELKISPDHKLLAYTIDTTGAEKYTLYIKNLETGKNLEDSISPVGDVTWANDNKTIFYTIEDKAGRSYKIFRHILGNDFKNDELLFHEKNEKFFVWTSKTKSREFIILGTDSKTTSEYRILKADDPAGKFTLIQERISGLEYDIQHHSDKFFIKTNADNATNFKIMTTSIENPSKNFWKDFIPYRDSVYVGFSVFKDFMVVYELVNGIEKMRVIDLNTDEDFYVEFPEHIYTVYNGWNPEFNTDIYRFEYESMITPYSVFDLNMKTGEKVLRKQQQVLKDFDSRDYMSEKVFAEASDGTLIPISMVYKKDIYRKNETNLLLLDAYGSYGDASDPYFSISRLSLLNRGFIYAIAHVRGGGELGKSWHEQGRMLKKKNSFTDFITCAEFLIENKYTESEKLVIEGGSAGGLLVGVVTNMRPELFKVVIADVPFVAFLNTMLDPTLSAVISEYEEWGDPNIKEYFDYMISYCPYRNIDAKDYPHILTLTGFYDTRVNFWEPARWVAKLRALKTDDNLLLLKTDMSAGHGGASGRFDYYEEVAFKYAFIFDIFGIKN